VMVPDEEPMVSPGGRVPVSLKLRDVPAPVSVALTVSAVIPVPETLLWLGGAVTFTALATVQLKVADPVAPVLSWAVSVTVYADPTGDPVVGVPEMVPFEVLKDNPGGRPDSDHEVIVPPTDEALGTRLVIPDPEVELWGPGLTTFTVSLTVQLKALLVPEKPAESVAVAVTE